MRVVRDKSGNFVSPQMNGEQQSKFPVIFHDSLQRRKLPGEHLVQEAESIWECDIQALETEQQLKELEAVVYDQVDFKHPIEFSLQELCSLAEEGKLKTKFKIIK